MHGFHHDYGALRRAPYRDDHGLSRSDAAFRRADELANGAQRAGAVSGIFTLVRKLVQAGVLWFVGILLSAIGYRADTVQTGRALLGIRSLFSFGPLIFVALGGVLAALYPITPAANAVLRAEPARRKTRGPSGSVENVPTVNALDALARITGDTRLWPGTATST